VKESIAAEAAIIMIVATVSSPRRQRESESCIMRRFRGSASTNLLSRPLQLRELPPLTADWCPTCLRNEAVAPFSYRQSLSTLGSAN
jgi:hypothetical protein